METDYATNFHLSHMDRRPKKRPRLAWDVSNTPKEKYDLSGFYFLGKKAQSGIYSGQDVGNVTSIGHSRVLSDNASLFERGLAQKGSPPWRGDDKDGHYIFELGENLTPRYKILRKLGEGTFGQVLECWDREAKEMVAIKVVRSIRKYREAAMIEVDVLQLLGRYDRIGSCHA